MKKYEYMSIDLSPTWTLNQHKKQDEMINRLNELGKDGWIPISGLAFVKHAVFMREITEDKNKLST